MKEIAAYRLAGWDYPFWVNPNRSAGRYNRAGSEATQYVCLHPFGPWAEYMRRNNIRSLEEADELRGRIWVVRLWLPESILLGEGDADPRFHDITFDNAADWGVEAADLVDDDHSACQNLGDRCRRTTTSKVISVPSASLPYTRNLVIFGARLSVPYEAREWDEEIDIPVSIVADRAVFPKDVVPLVRHMRAPHAEFETWRLAGAARKRTRRPT